MPASLYGVIVKFEASVELIEGVTLEAMRTAKLS